VFASDGSRQHIEDEVLMELTEKPSIRRRLALVVLKSAAKGLVAWPILFDCYIFSTNFN
jgi:hypothetical protein